MPTRDRDFPHGQTSAPVKPPSTTEDAAPVRAPDEDRASRREAREEADLRGDRMPKGADEPGAGM